MRDVWLSVGVSALLVACVGDEFTSGDAANLAVGGASGNGRFVDAVGGNVSASVTTLGGSAGIATLGGSAGTASGGKASDETAAGSGGDPVLVTPPVTLPSACRDLPKGSSSGVYSIDPDGSGPLRAFEASCDMETADGGWTLVLNYVHKGGTNPSLSVRNDALPRLGADALGVDESSAVSNWGHASTALLATLKPTALRFNARSSLHPRVIDFVTSDVGCLAYASGSATSCKGVSTAFTPLADHSAQLPRAASTFTSGQGNLALTEFPFYLGGQVHWGVRGAGSRWEADNTPVSGVPGYASDTIHRVWAR